MFEKEAEEWVKENMDCCRTENCTGKDIPYFDEEERCCAKSAFQDGAEFGYHKGFKACAKSRLNVTTISDCPIKDEWHYVKDGDLPTGDKDMLMSGHLILLTKLKGVDDLYVTLGRYNFSTQEFCYQHIVGLTDVVAWQEIVLPKENE